VRRKLLMLKFLFLALMASAVMISARADEPVEVLTELIAEVRETSGGTPERPIYRMVPAKVLAQGQVVYYTLRISNPTPVFAANVVVNQRVPDNTTYVADSAAGPGAQLEFSVDGGRVYAPAADLVATDGVTRPAPPEQYTHIRWRLRNPLAPGATAMVRFRAVFR
jgi:uncharacterized repeat protein (TIGR01451 family)